MLYIIYCWIVYIISLKFTEIHQSHITDTPHTRVDNKLTAEATQYQISISLEASVFGIEKLL